MTDHKFTDAEIVKALECCLNGNVNKSQVEVCSPCPFFHDGNCTDSLKQNALALINRQKAEIERLQADIDGACVFLEEQHKRREQEHKTQIELLDQIKEQIPLALARAKSEAIKEFAENVKAIFECVLYFDDDVKECILNEIDDLVKERTRGE